MLLLLDLGLKGFYSGIKDTEKDQVRLKVRHYLSLLDLIACYIVDIEAPH